MLKKEIEDLFKLLKLTDDKLQEYSDPYSFAEQIKKAAIVEDNSENIGYSIGTGSIN